MGLIRHLETKARLAEEEVADIIHLDQDKVLELLQKWLDDTYKVLIFYLWPFEEEAIMQSARRADLWRENSKNRLVCYLSSQYTACDGDPQLWTCRQATIAKHMLSDICSVLDYTANVAFRLTQEYCFASNAVREQALKFVSFPLSALADADVSASIPAVAVHLRACGILLARHISTHVFAPELAPATGENYLFFELMSLVTPGPSISTRALDVQFMNWCNSILTVRRSMRDYLSRMPPADREGAQQLPTDWPGVLYEEHIRGSSIARGCPKQQFETFCVCLSIFPPNSPQREFLVQLQDIAGRLMLCKSKAARREHANAQLSNENYREVWTFVKDFLQKV